MNLDRQKYAFLLALCCRLEWANQIHFGAPKSLGLRFDKIFPLCWYGRMSDSPTITSCNWTLAQQFTVGDSSAIPQTVLARSNLRKQRRHHRRWLLHSERFRGADRPPKRNYRRGRSDYSTRRLIQLFAKQAGPNVRIRNTEQFSGPSVVC